MKNEMAIDWLRAPSVPVDVLQRKAAGQPLGGEIIKGPFGQETFVADRQMPQQLERPVSYAPGGGVYATAK